MSSISSAVKASGSTVVELENKEEEEDAMVGFFFVVPSTNQLVERPANFFFSLLAPRSSSGWGRTGRRRTA